MVSSPANPALARASGLGSVNRKESYKVGTRTVSRELFSQTELFVTFFIKAQKKSYAREKKRVERELLSTFKDESIIVLADWLKVRGSLKSWTKLWCVLKPGLLLLYRSQKTKVRDRR